MSDWIVIHLLVNVYYIIIMYCYIVIFGLMPVTRFLSVRGIRRERGLRPMPDYPWTGVLSRWLSCRGLQRSVWPDGNVLRWSSEEFRRYWYQDWRFYDQSARLGWFIISDIQTVLECFDMFFCYQPVDTGKICFATCLDGDKRLWDSSPSSVMSSSPSVSISSLPTGNRLFTGTESFNRSRTVVCRLSLVALTQPAGLFSM